MADTEDLKNIKYVDIYKKDKDGNILVTKTMTDKDFETINKMGVKIKEVDKNVQTLSDKHNDDVSKNDFEIEQLRSQQAALKTRVEEVFNNGIDEIQQKRIEALEKVDLKELAAIEEAARNIDELRANGLTNMKTLQDKDLVHDQLIAANTAAIEDLRTFQAAKDNEQDTKIGNIQTDLKANVKTLTDSINVNKNNIDVLGSSLIDLKNSTSANDKTINDNIAKIKTDIEDLKTSVNSDISTKLNSLSESQTTKNIEQDLEIQTLKEGHNKQAEQITALQTSNDGKLVAVEGQTEVPVDATQYQVYFVETKDHIVF